MSAYFLQKKNYINHKLCKKYLTKCLNNII